jgi:hypothetical protein
MPVEEDTRGVSEGAGVAALVLLTVVVTASVGATALLMQSNDTEGIQANFTYEYLGERGTLLITHDAGDELEAGNVVIAGPETNITWATVAGQEETELITRGDLVQLSEGSAYGDPVRSRDTIRIVHKPADGNQTLLSTWTNSRGV